jgi:hypothetical protein
MQSTMTVRTPEGSRPARASGRGASGHLRQLVAGATGVFEGAAAERLLELLDPEAVVHGRLGANWLQRARGELEDVTFRYPGGSTPIQGGHRLPVGEVRRSPDASPRATA